MRKRQSERVKHLFIYLRYEARKMAGLSNTMQSTSREVRHGNSCLMLNPQPYGKSKGTTQASNFKRKTSHYQHKWRESFGPKWDRVSLHQPLANQEQASGHGLFDLHLRACPSSLFLSLGKIYPKSLILVCQHYIVCILPPLKSRHIFYTIERVFHSGG